MQRNPLNSFCVFIPNLEHIYFREPEEKGFKEYWLNTKF